MLTLDTVTPSPWPPRGQLSSATPSHQAVLLLVLTWSMHSQGRAAVSIPECTAAEMETTGSLLGSQVKGKPGAVVLKTRRERGWAR